MRKIFCDRCGKDITDEEKIGSAVFRWKDQEGHFIVSEAAVGYDSDYCPACMELMTTVASKIQAVEKTKPKKKAAAAAADQDTENEPKKPAKKGWAAKKEQIDTGKIGALYRNHWTPEQIADDMRLPIDVVRAQIAVITMEAPE